MTYSTYSAFSAYSTLETLDTAYTIATIFARYLGDNDSLVFRVWALLVGQKEVANHVKLAETNTAHRYR